MAAFYSKEGLALDTKEWALLFEAESYRGIAYNHHSVDLSMVSTIWMGIDLSFGHRTPPQIFESAVRDAKGEIVEMERTPTLKAALEAHRHLCAKYGVS